MILKFIQLTLHPQPTQYGPLISVLTDKITALEDSWNTDRNYLETKIHLIGGETFVVAERRDDLIRKWGDQLAAQTVHTEVGSK